MDWGRVIHSASFRRLQGKTQVFPGHESDFFRNRLTHSLEVAQIAEGIADKLNHDYFGKFGDQSIDSRLCATAALMHDLGHPPFGHNGERALDRMMLQYGGFEGNAQTLRIIARLEKKAYRDDQITDEPDNRLGLNLSYRSIAAILKYDNCIPRERKEDEKLCKGYYETEAKLVERVKEAVYPGWTSRGEFKTIECQIMDLADDIAYSTYDLEDSLKAGFLTPAKIMASSEQVLETVASKVQKEIGKKVTSSTVLRVFDSIFRDLIRMDEPDDDRAGEKETTPLARRLNELERISIFNRASDNIAENSHVRTQLSSELVGNAIKSVKMRVNGTRPALSKVYLSENARLRVEVLKQYTYVATIDSPQVKVVEFRGFDVVSDIFKSLDSERGRRLMPKDFRSQYELAPTEYEKKRTICDFVAGMTDRYAIEFYARLRSDSAQSMFKPT